MAGEIVHINELSTTEADLLNPVVWGGRAIGNGDRGGYRSVPIRPLSALRMLGAVGDAENMLKRAREDRQRFGASRVYQPGELFDTRTISGAQVLFDQELLVTRGRKPFSINPTEFPPHSNFRPSQHTAPQEYYLGDQRLHYWRGPAPVQTIRGESDMQPVVITRMANHVGLTEYYRQVGILAVPDVVQVGAVTHLQMHNDGASNGHEMLLRTNNVYVFAGESR